MAEASSGKQELRPWYHTSSLLCHLIKKGNKVYTNKLNDTSIDKTFRSLATVNHEGTLGGIVAVNAGLKPVTKTFQLNDKVEGDKVYVYIFNQNSYRLGEDGYIIPNYVIDGSINDRLTLTVDNSTAVFLSNERL